MKLRRLTLCCVVALATGLFVAGCSDAVSAIPQMEEREVATIFTTRDANAFRALFKEGLGRQEQFQGQALSVWCVRANWPEGLDILAGADYDLNATNTTEDPAYHPGFTALHQAILIDETMNGRLNREAMVRKLLALGADPDQACPYDNAGVRLERATPLMCVLLFPEARDLTAHEENVLICNLLLKEGANVNATSKRTVKDREETVSALSLAVLYGNTDLCRLLAAAGADPNQDLGNGTTPLSLAESKGNTYLARVLRGEEIKR